jgi:hypothetical protein
LNSAVHLELLVVLRAPAEHQAQFEQNRFLLALHISVKSVFNSLSF